MGRRRSSDSHASPDDPPWLIVGLGNPGPEYSGNRHNVGYLVVERLAGEGAKFKAHKRARALTWEGRVAGRRVVLVKPTTYMNDSGQAVAALCSFYKITPDRVLAIHDELDLPFGSLRLKYGGGDNGHNGLKSLRRSLGTGEFYRARLGIGRPPGRMDPSAFVLRDFSAAERTEVPHLVERVADAVTALLEEGLDRAQSQFND
ncbi:MAG TPA: aminoacyl-tRNA hydrolase [Actinomycetes bacterium]|nr:aminoacyl-tRNA hydrolase [Actinomycetes bacterium]